MTKHFNALSKVLETVGRRHDLSRVFNDFLTMGICSFHRTNIQSRFQIKDEDNEALYLQTSKSYDKDELLKFSEALGILQMNVLDDPYSDILGEFFMCNITRGQNGQYFTPMPLCEMMAQMQFENTNQDGLRVLDPASGSGRMLLAYARLNYRNYFFGADNTDTCSKMATLNFFLNGLKGEVAWMNSLSMEWYGGWQINTNGIGIIPIKKVESTIWTAPLQKTIEYVDPKEEQPQLTLF